MRKSLKWLLGLAALVAACAFMGDGVMWESVSGTFMKEIKPYGPGDFRVRDGQVIAMRLDEPVTSNKPMTAKQAADPNFVPEPVEPWMRNVNEIANRRNVNIFKGTVDGPFRRVFHERAQYGDWWLSPDWATVYLATRWEDYKIDPAPGQDDVVPTQKLWKSTGGDNWQQLDWPEANNITFLRFLDAQRGYLIGWGPRIWRTEDGGGHWTEIEVPVQARNPTDERQQFDLVALGEDNVLRFAFFAKQYDGIENASLVFALPWGTDAPRLAFTVPQQTVVDLLADNHGNVSVLGWDGLPLNYSIPGDSERKRPSVISRWDGEQLQRLHEFDAEITGYALYRTPSGHLLFDGIDDGLLPDDVVALSSDGGESWDRQDEGSGAQGGYYDTTTGTRWRVSGYTLSKREIP